jgi:hypothetical protein
MAENGGGGLSAGWVASLTAVAALLGALAGFGGAVATGWFAYASKNEELQVHLVEIAIGILRADASKEDVAPAREWALDIIDQKSGVKFSDADRKALLHQSIQAKDFSAAVKDLSDEIEQLKRSGIPVPPNTGVIKPDASPYFVPYVDKNPGIFLKTPNDSKK